MFEIYALAVLLSWTIFCLQSDIYSRHRIVAAKVKWIDNEPFEIKAWDVKHISSVGYILFDNISKPKVVNSLRGLEIGSAECFGIFLRHYGFM